MKDLAMGLYIVVVMIICFFLGVYSGEKTKQTEIEKRANKLPIKECYTNQDIELIIFNQHQL